MSKLDELIKTLCPDGVEDAPLWSVTTWDKKFNAVDRKKQPKVINYHYFLAGDLKSLVVENGDIKILTTNTSDLYTTEEYVADYISDGEIVAIPSGGNPNVQYFKGRFVTADNRIATSNNSEKLNNKYLYYFMQNKIDVIGSFYRGSGIKHPDMSKVLDLPIPLPPLSVQREIVRILDSFTALTAELTAELTARKKQYEFYRDSLLSFPENEVKWVRLGECCNVLDNKRKPVTKGARSAGKYPYYGANGIQDYVSDYIFDGSFVLVGEDGSVITEKGTPVVNWATGKIWVNNHAHIIEEVKGVSLRYLFHYLQTVDVHSLIHGNIPKLTGADFKALPIPLPSLSVQQKIVSILDRFDAICSDLKSGLPAEIAARQKQYEFYRDKLLTFKEL